MARYAIPSQNAFGVPVGEVKKYGKALGTDHRLALELWASGRYEARLLAAFVGDPAALTVRQMNAWCADFDSWAVVDTVCFHLFDRSPHAWGRIGPWAKRKPEFVRRAAFALVWGLTVHDKEASDAAFLDCLPLVEIAAIDERNFVKKAVSMALRAIGKRNRTLHAAALETARRLAAEETGAGPWIGRTALRELGSAKVVARLARGG
jgi:3-methyladenine DNA glycosylase AlkD